MKFFVIFVYVFVVLGGLLVGVSRAVDVMIEYLKTRKKK